MAKYNGHGIKANKSIDIAFKCAYDQLTNYIRLIQFLNVDTTIGVKISGEKPINLGTFRVREVKVDHDGEGLIKFNSMADFVNADCINQLIGSELVVLRCQATVELEDEAEDDDNEDEEE